MDLINLYDYEARAKQVLPHSYWEYLEAGAMDGLTTARNRSALEALTLRPRFMRDVTERKISTTVLGTDISFPVMISPADGHATAHPEGERATARGAGMSNTLMMCSTNSNNSMEEIAEVATGPLWFQLAHRGYNFTENLVKRAEAAGFGAIVLTIDAPILIPTERAVRSRYQRPGEYGNFREHQHRVSGVSSADETPPWEPLRCAPLTWKELDWLRSLTKLPLVLKGVRVAEDARRAVESGVDGILVSTHGGRRFDGDMSSIEVLPEVVAATQGKAEVYVDSGIRRGTDVLKALALGATAVGVGRPLFWGLAVNGAQGVHHVLELLREEFDRAMVYCGQHSVDQLEDRLLNIPRDWGPFRTENDIADHLPFARETGQVDRL
ncbi:MAG: alpha-hydroxy acid oxidase [bacterium]|nr:alpha-hydroxy acid oxidase [bacterium]